MCGIVGYTGSTPAKEKLISGLRRLEYRGYDSVGISVFDESGNAITYKTKGRIENLEKLTHGKAEKATCGIGHTRWATHGVPSDVNSHPHFTGKLSLVHNGIIENYLEIRDFLTAQGYTFASETDTEIAAKLLDYHYDGDPIGAIDKTTKTLEGAYALAIMFFDRCGEIFATRCGSPLVVTKSDDGLFLASDMPAVLEYTNNYYTLEVGEIACLSPSGEKFYTFDGKEVTKRINISSLTFEQAEKDGYEHFMLKEMNEQPKALSRTISPRITAENDISFMGDGIDDKFFSQFNQVHIVACGTAYYAGSLGAQIIRSLANVNCTPLVASEFRYSPPVLHESDLVILVSQSGETADTLAALRLAKEHNIKTLAIVNVAGSAIALEADYVVMTHAGPEIAVASTKAFSVQVAIFYLLAIKTASVRNALSISEARDLAVKLVETVQELKNTFALNDTCKKTAESFLKANSMFYIGRGRDCVLSLEGALKLKEISYIHCEAYAAGELKHGTISLITKDTPIISLVTDERLVPKTVSNMKEIKAREGKITAISLKGIHIPSDSYDNIIEVDCTHHIFGTLHAIIPLQLLAYHTACLKGCDVDKPRNLAKSVTVE